MTSSSSPVRVRFAPAPTGMMHLGNVRQALINLIYARQHQGSLILRIEDTDEQRMFDQGAEHIRADLAWLSIGYDEGPGVGGPYGPYFQSQRTSIYQDYLQQLQEKQLIYSCFCTQEELERKRTRQIELKKAPRYDRTCLKLSAQEIAERCEQKIPFIWRFKLEPISVTITDLVRGPINFDLANFSDFPLTRQDGSFTFIFANCIDDITMKISHIFRGEDHLSNTASQAMIYRAFEAPLPIFWHTPIVCNREGKKLSKRDFGFSLDDLRTGGFVPESIINYLASIGNKTEKQEIMTLEELVQNIDFTHHSSANTIRYDEDKLRWMNHAWIKKLPLATVAHRCRPCIEKNYPAAAKFSDAELERLIQPIQQELNTLVDCVPLLHCYFHEPIIDSGTLAQFSAATYQPIIRQLIAHISAEKDTQSLITLMKELCAEHKLPSKPLWALLRYGITGSAEGTSIANLFAIVARPTIVSRLEKIIS